MAINPQDSIRNIEQQMRAQEGLRRSVDDISRSYDNLLKRKHQDLNISKALEKATLNLKKRQRDLTDSLKKVSKEHEEQKKKSSDLRAAIKNLESAKSQITGKTRKEKDAIDSYNRSIEYHKISLEKSLALYRPRLNMMKRLGSAYKSVSSNLNKVKKAEDELNQISKQRVGPSSDLQKISEDYINAEKRIIDHKVKSRQISVAEGRELVDNLSTDKHRLEVRKKLLTNASSMLKKMEAIADESREASEELEQARDATKFKAFAGRAVSGMAGGVKGLFAGRGVGAKFAAGDQIKESMMRFKEMGTVVDATGKKAFNTATMIGNLGKALGMLGKLGWIGVIITAVQSVAKAVDRLDKFIKKYNQSFSKMYGPTQMIENVRGSMRDFTDSIFDLERNLKYGLKADAVVEFMDALNQAGLSAQGVGARIGGGYNEAIIEAVKLSREFGVTLSDMGGMVGQQMADLRSTLDEVSDSFKSISYDASIAGIQSQKFYQAILSASSALSFYGNYLDEASGKLKDYIKTGALGFKDAAEQVESLQGSIAKMDFTQRMTLGTFLGRETMEGVLKEEEAHVKSLLEKNAKKIEEYQAKLTKTQDEAEKEGIKERIKSVRENTKNLRVELVNLGKALGGKNIMAMVEQFGRVRDPETAIIRAIENKYGKDFWEDPLEFRVIAEGIAKNIGISEKQLMGIRKKFEGLAVDFVQMFEVEGVLDKINSNEKDMKKARESVTNFFEDFIGTGKDLDETAIPKKIGEDLKKLGIEMNDFVYSFSKNPELWMRTLKRGLKAADIEGLQEMIPALETSFREAQTAGPRVMVSARGEEAERDRRTQELIKNTTPIADYIGITKENLEYMAASTDLQNAVAMATIETSKNVGGIFKFLKHRWGGGEALQQEFNQSEQKDFLVRAYKEQKKMQDHLSSLEENGKKDTDEYKSTNDKLKKLNDQIKKEEATGLFKKLPYEKGRLKEEARMLQEKESMMMSELDILQKEIEKGEKTKENLEREKYLVDELNKMNMKSRTAKSVAHGFQDIPQFSGAMGMSVARSMSREATLGSGKYTTVAEQASVTPKKNEDFLTLKEGYTYLKKNDYVIDANQLSKGMAYGAGDLIKKVGGVSNAANINVPVSINVGSVNGDVDDLVKKIGPAIEQTFERMYFNKQKR